MGEVDMGITHRIDFSCWWPNYDHNPVGNHRKMLARVADADIVASYAKAHNVVVQAGGHVGYWPKRLSGQFEKVYTFEPDPRLFKCMMLNLAGVPKDRISFSSSALGDVVGPARMSMHPSAGSWRIAENGPIVVHMVTIDSLNLQACDAIVLDIESYERPALIGATETIKRFSPVIHIEVPKARDVIMGHMESIGYQLVGKIHSDRIFVRRK